MPKSKTELFEIIFGQTSKHLKINIGIHEQARILAKAKSLEPMGQIVHGDPRLGPSYRNPGFQASRSHQSDLGARNRYVCSTEEPTSAAGALTYDECHEQTSLLPPTLIFVSVKLSSALVTVLFQPLRLVAV
jgi:hypothetical protein